MIDEQALSGAADVLAQVGGRTQGVGETLGVASMVLGSPLRQYGMVASEKSLFIRISQDDFLPMLGNHPELE